jgi:hypothetical protein
VFVGAWYLLFGVTLPPDWAMIRQVVRIVHADPCGGIHREGLAEMLQLPAGSRALSDVLVIAYRSKKIDFCRQYIQHVPSWEAI